MFFWADNFQTNPLPVAYHRFRILPHCGNMKMLGLVLVLVTTIGCGPALHPFYTSSDLYEDLALEGRWINGEEAWEFLRTGDGRYRVAECDPECKDEVTGMLFRLGGQLFLDVQEERRFSSGVFPHGVIRLRVTGDTVEVTPMDEDSVREGLEQKRFGLTYVAMEDKRLLLTAPTAKLQQFLMRHALDPQVWGGTQVYRRAADGPGTPSQTGF